jgi:ATP-dependent protease HslVU (ClpYQ) peptidase subunit
MSIVVAVRKRGQTCLAADSQNNFGSHQVPGDNSRVRKVRRVGEALLGATGWGIYDNILDELLRADADPKLESRERVFDFFLGLWKALHERYPFVNDQAEKDDSPFGNVDASFLVASAAGILYVASDLSVTPFEKYFAIGSGADFALGAAYNLYDQDLTAEEIAVRCVETAVAFNVYCGGETRSLLLRDPTAGGGSPTGSAVRRR